MTEETKAMDKWDGLMEQIQQEVVLLCDCVQKGLLDEGMIIIKVTKDEEGRAAVDVGLAVPDGIAEKIDEVRKQKRN